MRFPGIIPAVTTPFAASGEVDHDALQANVRALLDAGVHGIVGDRHDGRGRQPQHRASAATSSRPSPRPSRAACR